MKKKRIALIDYVLSGLFFFGAGYSFISGYIWLVTLTLAVIGGFILLYNVSKQLPHKILPNVKRISLLDIDGKAIKEWHIVGKSGLIIGKSYKNQRVDVDLADTEYAILIAQEHAVLNFVDGYWYIEDLGSRNGTGVKSKQDSRIKRLGEKETYQIRAGDKIYIAKTLLEVN
ncbi:FHA domain-containing protein [Listeria goaensis]|uniref:FHA domain-containing protein n=1 Tax=Listeria goaensis TaxID=1649188 RepID=UPI0013C31ECF|nr:FHA domain-containing protein [Listeria goaensis]